MSGCWPPLPLPSSLMSLTATRAAASTTKNMSISSRSVVGLLSTWSGRRLVSFGGCRPVKTVEHWLGNTFEPTAGRRNAAGVRSEPWLCFLLLRFVCPFPVPRRVFCVWARSAASVPPGFATAFYSGPLVERLRPWQSGCDFRTTFTPFTVVVLFFLFFFYFFLFFSFLFLPFLSSSRCSIPPSRDARVLSSRMTPVSPTAAMLASMTSTPTETKACPRPSLRVPSSTC